MNNIEEKKSHVYPLSLVLPRLHQQQCHLPATSPHSAHPAQPWTLFFYPEFAPVILSEQFTAAVAPLAQEKQSQAQLCQEMVIKGVPLLVHLHKAQKEIRVGTSRLHRELFLLQNLSLSLPTGSTLSSLSPQEEQQLRQLQAHVQVLQDPAAWQMPLTAATQMGQLVDLWSESPESIPWRELEKRSWILAQKLLAEIKRYSPSFMERVSDFVLGLTAQYELLRVHLLKFLAILPNLQHDEQGKEVKRLFLESLRRLLQDGQKEAASSLPAVYVFFFRYLLTIGKMLPASLLAASLRMSTRFMARRFIAGENITDANRSLAHLRQSGREATLDQLGELVVSEVEAEHYCQKVLELIVGLSQQVRWGERNGAGLPCAHISIKVSALCADFLPHASESTYLKVGPRLQRILLKAQEQKVFINIDAEHYHYRDAVLAIYARTLLETPLLQNYGDTGIVLQAYLRDAAEHLQQILSLAQKRGLSMAIRLVKGAYWDAETIEAQAHNFTPPQFLNKEETDLHFRQLGINILQNGHHLQLCLASHNMADHCFLEQVRSELYSHAPVIEHQCLHMTFEALSMGLKNLGFTVRNYVPVGSLLVGMGYLVRRIMENSSQVGVLTQMRTTKNMRGPSSPSAELWEKKRQGLLQWDPAYTQRRGAFFNIPPLRTYVASQWQSFQEEMQQWVQQQLGKVYPNQFQTSGRWKEIHCASEPSLLVGKIQFANKADALAAVVRSEKAYLLGNWAKNSGLVRASVLLAAQDLMLVQRNLLAALIVYEAGKTMTEALADVDEAIDFLNFYSRQEAQLDLPSRGVMVVIAPWNFPLAIACGMTCGALLAGNTVILKSAEQTPLVAQLLVDILLQSGVPADVLIHLPGEGEEVGAALVQDSRIAGVVFTGSRRVGTWIMSEVNKRVVENKLLHFRLPPKVIAEMGGKNAIIITNNAELDETVVGCLQSAFGHAGQKCSAASRILVHKDIKENFIQRFREACFDLVVGKSFEPATRINPVISAQDKDRLIMAVEDVLHEVQVAGGRVIVNRLQENFPGFCVGPVVVELPRDKAMQMESLAQKELFGPVVHVIEYDTLEEAVELLNHVPYGLTGGIFSQSQDDIDMLVKNLQVGNIYVNRSCTGARVGIEPFGGLKMSGTGPKAGGPSYLLSLHAGYQEQQPAAEIQNEKQDEIPEQLPSDIHLQVGRIPTTKREIEEHLAKLLLALNVLLENFHDIFGQQFTTEKKGLQKFAQWMRKNLADFITGSWSNLSIPGQISYNDYSLSKKAGLLLVHNMAMPLPLLQHVFAALGMGATLNIVATGQNSYRVWKKVADILQQAGLGAGTCNGPFLVSRQKWPELLQKSTEVEFVIDDGDLNEVQKLLELVSQLNFSQPGRNYLLSVHSLFDTPPLEAYPEYCMQFSYVRSMAVNTMRHGAPLSLESQFQASQY